MPKASLSEEAELRSLVAVGVGYLWQGLHRHSFMAVEVNGNKVVKHPLGFCCLKGDTLTGFSQAASST